MGLTPKEQSIVSLVFWLPTPGRKRKSTLTLNPIHYIAKKQAQSLAFVPTLVPWLEKQRC